MRRNSAIIHRPDHRDQALSVGLELAQKDRNKKQKRAQWSFVDTLLRAIYNATWIVLLLLGVLMFIAYWLNSFHQAYMRAEKEILFCDKMVLEFESHTQEYEESSQRLAMCVIISQSNVWLFAVDQMVEHTWLLQFIKGRLQTFGYALDGTVSQHINMMVVFLVICVVVIGAGAYIIIEWMRQEKKKTRARQDLREKSVTAEVN